MADNPAMWFQNELRKLESENNKAETLENMKSFLLNVEKSVLNEIVRKVPIQPLIKHFHDFNSQEIDFLCVVVYELLSQLEPTELLTNYGSSIQEILTHNKDEVKRVGLRLLEKSICDETGEYLMTKQICLVMDAAGCLALEDRSTAQGAISAFIKLGTCSSGVKFLFSDVVLKKFKEVMGVNDTSRFRIYEIIATVAKTSPESLSASISSGLLGSLLSEVNSSDILVQLNALEILSTLATSNHGLNYLLESGVVQALAGRVLKLQEEPLSQMLLPGLIEFFGNVFIQQPESFANEYPHIINLLFSSLENNDQVLLGVLVSTVGKIASTNSGRLVLVQHTQEMNDFLKKMMEFLGTKNDLALNILSSLCEMLKKIDDDDSSKEVTEGWFHAMGPNTLDRIISFTKLPFADFRMSALSVLKTIANHEWGTRKLSSFPGMIEYLLDRSSEFNKDCKQMKYDVAFNMVHSPNVDSVIPSENMKSLKEFVKEGPFYIPTEVEIATEGAN